MSADPVQAGRQQAMGAWSAGRARLLIHGDPSPHRSQLASKGLYVGVYDEADSLAAIERCRSYNETVDSLIEEHGLPEWAPAKRLPDRREAIRLMHHFFLTSSYEPQSVREGRLVRVVSAQWKGAPSVMARDPTRALLLIAGNTSRGAARIDVLDVREFRWMTSYEFLRKHQPNMPWD